MALVDACVKVRPRHGVKLGRAYNDRACCDAVEQNATGDVDAYYMITCGNVVGGKGVDDCKGGE